MPSGQPEFMCVFHPGIGTAAFANDRADVRAGNDISPRRRRTLPRLESNHVFSPVGCEATQAVAENTLALWQRMDRFIGRWKHRRQPARQALCRCAALHLLYQRLGAVTEHDAGDRLEQNPVLLGKFFGAAYEHAPGFVEYLRFGTRVDQAYDLVLQNRPVA